MNYAHALRRIGSREESITFYKKALDKGENALRSMFNPSQEYVRDKVYFEDDYSYNAINIDAQARHWPW